jgi:predicted RNA binding protein YcfA (HicA-like mRNA interferase family)
LAKLPRVTFREFRGAIERGGCFVVRRTGSHDFYRNPATGGTTSVGRHLTEHVKPGTLGGMLKDLGITPDELRRLL